MDKLATLQAIGGTVLIAIQSQPRTAPHVMWPAQASKCERGADCTINLKGPDHGMVGSWLHAIQLLASPDHPVQSFDRIIPATFGLLIAILFIDHGKAIKA